jgi:CoA:oxalate CoA-transferase
MQGIQALKKGPLEGITVLDFSRVLAGPYCTMVLADLGARVIKIEKLGSGDDTRAFGPFVDGESAYFMCFNRGKESIALDIKSPRDRELLELSPWRYGSSRLWRRAAGQNAPTYRLRIDFGIWPHRAIQ